VLPSMQQDAVSKLNNLLMRREDGGVVEDDRYLNAGVAVQEDTGLKRKRFKSLPVGLETLQNC